MENSTDIICKFILSCGNFGSDDTDPNIYAAFWGSSIEIKLGSVVNGIVYPIEINKQNILNKFEEYLKTSCKFSPSLMEYIPKLFERLHLHDEINDEFIASVAISIMDNKVPKVYICDHKH